MTEKTVIGYDNAGSLVAVANSPELVKKALEKLSTQTTIEQIVEALFGTTYDAKYPSNPEDYEDCPEFDDCKIDYDLQTLQGEKNAFVLLTALALNGVIKPDGLGLSDGKHTLPEWVHLMPGFGTKKA